MKPRPARPPIRAPWILYTIYCYHFHNILLVDGIKFQGTLAFIQGNRMPMLKIPRDGPLVIDDKFVDNWNTHFYRNFKRKNFLNHRTCNTWDPVFSTTNTSATQITPRTTTVSFSKMSAVLGVKGVFLNGLMKSSNTTAAIEFKPVDNELKYEHRQVFILLPQFQYAQLKGNNLNAALNTPATKRPGRPGYPLNIFITSNGNSWSFAPANCVKNNFKWHHC